MNFVNLHIAEVAYKLNLIEVALEALKICQQNTKKDKYLVHLLKGKCFDKLNHYNWAVEEYRNAI